MPSQSTRAPPSSTTTKLHFVYTAPSQEPLHPGVPLQQDDQATQLPYHHAHDLTAPIPDYDPTARAQYEWEKSWARKPVSPPAQGLEQRIITNIESQSTPIRWVTVALVPAALNLKLDLVSIRGRCRRRAEGTTNALGQCTLKGG